MCHMKCNINNRNNFDFTAILLEIETGLSSLKGNGFKAYTTSICLFVWSIFQRR